jgi:urease accessory protein
MSLSMIACRPLPSSCTRLATILRVGPDVDARTVVHSATDATQRLAEHAELHTTLPMQLGVSLSR